MIRCLIWGTGKVFFRNINILKNLIDLGRIHVVAITGDNDWQKSISGFKFVPKNSLIVADFDLVIVMSDNKKNEIVNEACKIGFGREMVVSYQVLYIPNLDLKKYMQLKRDEPTIFSMNCWGGITYYQLGLEFSSPFINMFLAEQDFVRFLKKPKWYIGQKLELVEMRYNPQLDINFPVCRCGDIILNFNHYPSLKEAVGCWNRRKNRINWNNIVAIMYTEDIKIATEFDKLPFDKKICFTSFETGLKSTCYLEFTNEIKLRNTPLSSIVSGMAWGIYPYYEAVDLLLTGKIENCKRVLLRKCDSEGPLV